MLLKGKIPRYVNKQLREINQKLRLNDLMSLNLTFSVSPSFNFELSVLSCLAAILSMIMIAIPDAYEIQQIISPNSKATPRLLDFSAIGGSTKLLKTDPSLEIVMFRPRANASSLPKNHLLTTTVQMTFILSPPKPNTTLPTIAIQNPEFPFTKPPIVKIPYPSVNNV